MKNKIIVVLGLFAFVFIGIAATKPGSNKERNLKVLQSGFCGTAIYHFSIIPVTLNKTHYHALISKGIQRLSHLNESGDLQQKQTCNETTLEPRHQLF